MEEVEAGENFLFDFPAAIIRIYEASRPLRGLRVVRQYSPRPATVFLSAVPANFPRCGHRRFLTAKADLLGLLQVAE